MANAVHILKIIGDIVGCLVIFDLLLIASLLAGRRNYGKDGICWNPKTGGISIEGTLSGRLQAQKTPEPRR